PFARELARERLRERDDAALAGRVDAFAGGADARRVGRDVDDAAPAARRHAGRHDVLHVERAAQVDVDQLLPFLGLGVEEILEAIPAGVVDQNIDGVFFKQSFHLAVLRNIEYDSPASYLPCGPSRRSLVAVGNQNFGTRFGESSADRGTDGAAAARYQ